MDDIPGRRCPAELGRPPVADYDHMTMRGLERHLGTLDQAQVEALVRYESAHENRTPVMRLLTARLHRLREAGRSPDLDAPAGGYGPAPATSRPGHSIPGLPAAGAPDPTPLPPPAPPDPTS
ncbi:hypothetical protein [Actinacidiphila acidipaludis]|uniref:DUF8129 domain-containing protein n=1 Tax=Actinacidiphila acidipaludis TaxID=2873382 RepID=A0ABS7QDJ2_9ACTN|nr:hypothetical protein [Streptomyces acidipaludis]MBY8881043.1 hypothetical protein [Streptomyces acidipaludis]